MKRNHLNNHPSEFLFLFVIILRIVITRSDWNDLRRYLIISRMRDHHALWIRWRSNRFRTPVRNLRLVDSVIIIKFVLCDVMIKTTKKTSNIPNVDYIKIFLRTNFENMSKYSESVTRNKCFVLFFMRLVRNTISSFILNANLLFCKVLHRCKSYWYLSRTFHSIMSKKICLKRWSFSISSIFFLLLTISLQRNRKKGEKKRNENERK